MENEKFVVDSEKWDSKELGASSEHAAKVAIKAENAIIEALGLQLISVRLQKGLIEDLKFISKSHGIGYQPLIRDVLTRFVISEKKTIMRDILEQGRLELEAKHQEALAKELDVDNKKAA